MALSEAAINSRQQLVSFRSLAGPLPEPTEIERGPEFLSAEMRRAQRKRPENLNAWDAFMRGYWHLLRYTRSDNAEAQRLLAKAIKIDPLRGNYHAVLAVTNPMDALYGWDEDAVEWSRKTIDVNPQFPGGYRSLAASTANLGRLKEAKIARKKLQELLPHVTIAQLRENLPYFRKSADLERYLGGLRKAGLPD